MRTSAAMITVALSAGLAPAAVKTQSVDYSHDGVALKGYLAYDDAAPGQRPGVLLVHEWWGLNDYAKKRAEMLAELGYVAFAVDMYGGGKVAEHPDQAGEMAGALRKNAAMWEGRAKAGLAVLTKQARVDPKKIAAIGYCFGGSTALQLAMTGADLRAVVTFHAALPEPTAQQAKAIKAKVLVCHGAEDTFIPEATCQKFRSALDQAKVDYQMIYYGGAVHSFTVPDVEKRGVQGLKYDANADRRSWASMRVLFEETIGK